ncbi:MAG: alpha/beta hydrolase [Erysipelotrichaceae bacterium]|nr:alpha/beta hydrolase [Erysipelotrichaceae bacterium]
MIKEEFTFPSSDGHTDIRAVRYVPDVPVRAILQIAHGMVEFIDRYENFAAFLCEKGYLVTGNDHLGHGASVKSEADWGYFGADGNRYLLDDMHELMKITKGLYPDLPYYLMGHSMGSFYARQYLFDYDDGPDKAIIMGTGFEPKAVLKAGMFLCKVIALFRGWRYRSGLVNSIAFGSYNKQFEPARTSVDWLSKDEKLVDWYLNEPRCTFRFTVNGYYEMFKGITRLHDRGLLGKVPKDLPLLFVSGKEDPVGTNGAEVEAAVKSLTDVGVKDITVKLYENDRHEILNETDKETVYEDIYRWLETGKI